MRQHLWVQHWSAGTDLEDHEFVRFLPFRGPSRLSSDGEQLFISTGPVRRWDMVYADSFTTARESATEETQGRLMQLLTKLRQQA